MEPYDISRPASSNDSAPVTPAFQGHNYSDSGRILREEEEVRSRQQFGLSAGSEAKAPKKQKAKAREEEAWRKEEARAGGVASQEHGAGHVRD